MTVEWKYFQTCEDSFFFLIYLPYILSQAATEGCAPTKQGRKSRKEDMETQETGADTAEGQRESPGYWQQLWSGASALTSVRTDKVHKDVQTG